MKKYVFMIMMSVAVWGTITAQSPRKQNRTPEQQTEQQVKRLDKKLNLSDQQEKEMKTLYEDFFKEQSASSNNKRAKREELDKKIEALLTDEQKKTYNEMKKEQKQKPQKGRR